MAVIQSNRWKSSVTGGSSITVTTNDMAGNSLLVAVIGKDDDVKPTNPPSGWTDEVGSAITSNAYCNIYTNTQDDGHFIQEVEKTPVYFEGFQGFIVVGDSGNSIYCKSASSNGFYQLSLNGAYDFSVPCYYTGVECTLLTSAHNGFGFNGDGTKLIILDTTNNTLDELTLSTGWLLSSASTTANTYSFSSQTTAGNGFLFNDDGTRCYIATTDGFLYEYTLSSAYDITSTVTYTNQSISTGFSAGMENPAFNDDGTILYLGGGVSDDAIKEYALSTGWDLSSASLTTTHTGYTTPYNVSNIIFNDDGTQVLLGRHSSASVWNTVVYDLSSAYDITSDSVANGFDPSGSLGQVKVGAHLPPDANGFLYVATLTGISTVQLTTAGDISSFVDVVDGIHCIGDPDYPADLGRVYFKADGTKLYRSGHNNDRDKRWQYTLATAWDFSTISYDGSYTTEAGKEEFTFSDDGTKLYVWDGFGTVFRQYTLTTAWDLTGTVTDNGLSSAITASGSWLGTVFDTDGLTFHAHVNGDDTEQYTLATAWDVTSTITAGVTQTSGTHDVQSAGPYVSGYRIFVGTATNTRTISYNTKNGFDLPLANSFTWDLDGEDTHCVIYELTNVDRFGTFPSAIKDNGKVATPGTDADSTVVDYVIGGFVSDQYNPTNSLDSNLTLEENLFTSSGAGDASLVIGTKSATDTSIPAMTHGMGSTDECAGFYIGFDETVINHYSETGGSGSFTHSGKVATLDRTFGLAGSLGVFVLAGQEAIVRPLNNTLDALVGSYSLAGQAVTLENTFPLRPAGSGSFSLSGGSIDVFICRSEPVLLAGEEFDTSTLIPVAWDHGRATIHPHRCLRMGDSGWKMFILGDYPSGYIWELDLSTRWDISTAVYNGVRINPGRHVPSIGNLISFRFDKKGTLLLVSYEQNSATPLSGLVGLQLNTRFSLNTLNEKLTPYEGDFSEYLASYNPSIGSTDQQYICDAEYSLRGHRIYMAGAGALDAPADHGTLRVYQGEMSPSWDVDSLAWNSFLDYLDISSEVTEPAALSIDGKGKKFYVLCAVTDRVYQYNLTTAWDITSGSYASLNYLFPSERLNISWGDSGRRLYSYDVANNKFLTYEVSPPYKLDGGCSFAISCDSGSFIESGQDITIKLSDPRMNAESGAFTQTLWVLQDLLGMTAESGSCDLAGQDVIFTPGELTANVVFEIKEEDYTAAAFSPRGNRLIVSIDGLGITYGTYKLGRRFDITTIILDSFVESPLKTTHSGDAPGHAIKVNPDVDRFWVGTVDKMRDILQYELLGKNDFSDVRTRYKGDFQCEYPDRTSIFYTGSPDPYDDFHFSPDGLTLFILREQYQLRKYALTTAWDLSTSNNSEPDQELDLSTAIGDRTSANLEALAITFTYFGEQLYVVGDGRIYQYTLSTGYDLSSASYDSYYDHTSEDASAQQTITTFRDGAVLIIGGETPLFDDLNYVTYDLSTPGDITTIDPRFNRINFYEEFVEEGAFTLAGQDATMTVAGVALMPADAGSYTLSGQSVTTTKDSNEACVKGSLSLAGQAAGLILGRAISAAVGVFYLLAVVKPPTLKRTAQTIAGLGAFVLAGQSAALAADTTIPADAGTYTLSGQTATLAVGYAEVATNGVFTLSAGDTPLTKDSTEISVSGAFTLGGDVTTLQAERNETAATGIYLLAGQDADFIPGFGLDAISGTYILAGQAATLSTEFGILSATGTYTLSGQDTTHVYTYNLGAGNGSFALSGQDVVLAATYLDLPANAGSYSLSGQDVTLQAGYVDLAANSGSFSLSGQATTLFVEYGLPAVNGTYALSGQVATLDQAFGLPAGAGAYTLAGQDTTHVYTYNLNAISGSYSLAGQVAVLYATRLDLPANSGAYTLAGQDAILSSGIDDLPAGTGTYSLSGQTAELITTRVELVDAGTYVLDGKIASLNTTYADLLANFGAYTLTGQVVGLQFSHPDLPANTGTYALAGQTALLAFGHAEQVASGSYSLSGQDIALAATRDEPAGAGAYALTGQDAALEATNADLPAASGSYALTGQSVFLRTFVPDLQAVAGSYSLAGQDTVPASDRNETADTGNYSITGQDVIFTSDRSEAAIAGIYTLAGQDITLEATNAALAADSGSFTLSGQDSVLRAGITDLPAATGSYSLAGQDAALYYDHKEIFDSGSYSIAGQDAELSAERKESAGTGTYTLAGQDADLDATNADLIASSGSYSLAGQASTLAADRNESAGAGAYTLSGQSASLDAGRSEAAGTGAFVLQGQDATLDATNDDLPAESGAYVLAGQNTALTVDRTEQVDSGAYVLAGQDAVIAASILDLLANFGSFALAGQDAGLTADRSEAVDSGAYTLSGQEADLAKSIDDLPAVSGSFNLTGQDVTFVKDSVMPVDAGAYSLSGQDVSLRLDAGEQAGPGAYALAGQDTVLDRTLALAAYTGTYVLEGQPATLLEKTAFEIPAASGGFNLAGQDVAISRDSSEPILPGSYALAGQDATPAAQTNISTDTGSYTLAGQDAALDRTRAMLCVDGAYLLAGQDTTLTPARSEAAGTGAYSLQGQDSQLSITYVDLVAGSGAFTLAGQDTDLFTLRSESALSGAYLLSGQEVTIARSYKEIAVFGDYNLDGQDAGITSASLVPAETGAYLLSGNSADLPRYATEIAGSGSYLLDGKDVELSIPLKESVEAGLFYLTGQSAALHYGQLLPPIEELIDMVSWDAGYIKVRIADEGVYLMDIEKTLGATTVHKRIVISDYINKTSIIEVIPANIYIRDIGESVTVERF